LLIDEPRSAYKKIISDAGPLRLDHAYSGTLRDEVDARLIENVVTLNRNHISKESDLKGVSNAGFGTFKSAPAMADADEDGMPDVYEDALRGNSRAKDHNEEVRGASFFPEGSADGYTRLEEYLHFKSLPHAFVEKGKGPSAEIDLGKYTAGFTKSPKFTISAVTGGKAIQGGPGGKLVRFTAGNSAGRGGFLFTVSDADGDTWTRSFAICVTGS
jgi:hypothetical protein